MMKNYTAIVLFLLVFNVLSAQNRDVYEFTGKTTANLVGNYERLKDFMSAPAILMLKENGKFELVTGVTSVQGRFVVVGGKVSFFDERGEYAATLAGEGIYDFMVNGNDFTLKCVKDKAIQRKDVLKSAGWRKVDNLVQLVGN